MPGNNNPVQMHEIWQTLPRDLVVVLAEAAMPEFLRVYVVNDPYNPSPDYITPAVHPDWDLMNAFLYESKSQMRNAALNEIARRTTVLVEVWQAPQQPRVLGFAPRPIFQPPPSVEQTVLRQVTSFQVADLEAVYVRADSREMEEVALESDRMKRLTKHAIRFSTASSTAEAVYSVAMSSDLRDTIATDDDMTLELAATSETTHEEVEALIPRTISEIGSNPLAQVLGNLQRRLSGVVCDDVLQIFMSGGICAVNNGWDTERSERLYRQLVCGVQDEQEENSESEDDEEDDHEY
ncbi:Hypothetical predicted protein [Lecanosticta acicola]|uniref:Uncharacterized protein n=1 Tax=Lecanosticta acicola TaxID=111012 RepID=A0AAI8Z8Z6_9PEZI|nr:Hypothetical predicted protein [Lecanosticta acicola]